MPNVKQNTGGLTLKAQTGGGWGGKDPVPAGWVISRGFEGGTLGEAANAGDAFDSASGGSSYTDEQASTGTQAVKCAILTNGTSWGGTINHTEDIVKGEELWLSMDLYLPAAFDTNTGVGTLKFLRLRFMNGGVLDGYIDLSISNTSTKGTFVLTNNGLDAIGVGIIGTDDIVRDQWTTIEIYMKMDDIAVDDGGTGITRVYKDGKPLLDELGQTAVTGMRTLNSSTYTATGSLFFSYFNSGSPSNQHCYLDNIVLQTQIPSNVDGSGNPVIGTGYL